LKAGFYNQGSSSKESKLYYKANGYERIPQMKDGKPTGKYHYVYPSNSDFIKSLYIGSDIGQEKRTEYLDYINSSEMEDGASQPSSTSNSIPIPKPASKKPGGR
jgi:hypothetical protein